jgi:diguanylate cyclase (GGDEF)-like protein/PAS domain S-box-containing protein
MKLAPIGSPHLNNKTKKALTEELVSLRRRIQELEQSEAERRKAETQRDVLEISESLYWRLFETTQDGILILDADTGQILDVNPFLMDMLSYSKEAFLGKDLWEIVAFKDTDASKIVFGELQSKGYVRYDDLSLATRVGQSVDVEFVSNVFSVNHTKVAQCNIRDITARKQIEALLRESEERYRKLSIVDDLTQLYNSRYFYHQLKIEIDRVNRYEQPLTLLLFDLDDFKRFNDTYGHIEGDQVLSRFGEVVKRCLRQTDSAYRYGGEEFTVILPMTTSEDGTVTAERIRAELKKEIFPPVSGKHVYITVSIGLAQYKSQEDMKAFVHRVDQLMYQAKKNGKDRVYSEL